MLLKMPFPVLEVGYLEMFCKEVARLRYIPKSIVKLRSC